ncbi:MAG: hypothetical protein M4579_001653 [Chaenotheca gracillima]|nr:MAG: hypothetical protein M4579_001653 [Chaenotheca gracillima]
MGYAEPGQRNSSPTLESQSNRGDETDRESNYDSRPSPTKSGSYSPTETRKHRQSDSVASATGTPVLNQNNADTPMSQLSHFSDQGNISLMNNYNVPPLAYADERVSPVTKNSSPPSQQGPDHRVPYFRYFGPTAIVPGFKQMVVQVKEHRRSTGAQTSSAASVESPSSAFAGQSGAAASMFGTVRTPSQSGNEPRTTLDLPFYDPKHPMPNSPLITHLVETFFIHLGCNFPFLQRERFQKDVEDKKVDAILVDAVCAMSARFSTHPLLTTPHVHSFLDESEGVEIPKSEYGQPFAQRAKDAVARTFSCPSVAVVQACLLLAYEEFGGNHDSGLWMYLGIAIRMAQDLGMNKLEGIRFEGRGGPTPKTAKLGDSDKTRSTAEVDNQERKKSADRDSPMIESQKAAEKERVDTFWAVFFLDRVISSGTGRPVTLRDKDVELSFPSQEDMTDTGYPPPFPALIRIIHLYGRVTDLLNNIKEVKHVTPETLHRLAGMEKDLTGIYQRLSPTLHFNVVNFQHYVQIQQGTNFILLHFWFHTLIVLVHQPTLLHSFEGRIQQLFPDSRELSMSSAKTIADILAFAELLDAKSFIGNPFTSQPMYIAACAFLMESAAHTASDPASRDTTPPLAPRSTPSSAPSVSESLLPNADSRGSSMRGNALLNASKAIRPADSKAAKHTLLATAANQNYQRCYKALKSLETYWAGTKYIVTVLDQKVKGIGDPLLYTVEEMESSLEQPNPEPAFTSPGWRRKPSLGVGAGAGASFSQLGHLARPHSRDLDSNFENGVLSPKVDPSQAFGFSLTGTTNSPNSNLTFLYQTTNGEGGTTPNMSQPQINPANTQLPLDNLSSASNAARALRSPSSAYSDMGAPPIPHYPKPQDMNQTNPQSRAGMQHLGVQPSSHPTSLTKFSPMSSDPQSTSEAEMLLGLNSPYGSNSNPSIGTPHLPSTHAGAFDEAPSSHTHTTASHPEAYDYSQVSQHPSDATSLGFYPPGVGAMMGQFVPGQDMMIESQDVDMSALGDVMTAPWMVEYLPQDMLNYFDATAAGAAAQGVTSSGTVQGDPNTGAMGPSGGPTSSRS